MRKSCIQEKRQIMGKKISFKKQLGNKGDGLLVHKMSIVSTEKLSYQS